MLLTVRCAMPSTRSIMRRSCWLKISPFSLSLSASRLAEWLSTSASSCLPLSMRSTASAVRSRSGRTFDRKRRRLNCASWFNASIITEKPIAA
ncbi:Uncharacterised protein [Serratia marcescens]|nr:Uncharacterised protein [Serratia marcescens]